MTKKLHWNHKERVRRCKRWWKKARRREAWTLEPTLEPEAGTVIRKLESLRMGSSACNEEGHQGRGPVKNHRNLSDVPGEEVKSPRRRVTWEKQRARIRRKRGRTYWVQSVFRRRWCFFVTISAAQKKAWVSGSWCRWWYRKVWNHTRQFFERNVTTILWRERVKTLKNWQWQFAGQKAHRVDFGKWSEKIDMCEECENISGEREMDQRGS